MKSKLSALLTAVLAFYCNAAAAAVIDFAGLPGNNLDPFSSFTEFGFTVTNTAGNWFVVKIFGNPVPSVGCQTCGPGTLHVTGGQFTFGSVDIGEATPTSFGYTITGFLSGVQVLSQTGTLAANMQGSWSTIASNNPSQSLDSLFISINTANVLTNDGNIDNINLGAVTAVVTPLPAALPLFASGLVGLGLLGWRKKKTAP
jgi:hypothetical protein